MRKSAIGARALRVQLMAAAVASCFAAGPAYANPSGHSVAHGAVNVSGGSGALTITNTGGTSAIINWSSFSIDPGELTRFQNFLGLSVLNRVTGTSMSNILGALQSDGRLFLINPNGIVIGGGAFIDVPGFVASTLEMSNDDFLAGRMRFQEAPGTTAGTVENYASIHVSGGGPVYLVGRSVTSGGVITNPSGEVVLAAGQSVELVEGATPGVSVLLTAPGDRALNLSSLSAGRVGIYGALVEQAGFVGADAAFLGPDGSIQLRATEATMFAPGSATVATGTLDIETGALLVSGYVQTGPQTVQATQGLQVHNGTLGATNGQAIEAQFVEVASFDGGFAGITNSGGTQRILTTGVNGAGEGLAVRRQGAGFATIGNSFGEQQLDVRDAERAVIDQGFVFNDGGLQTLSLTGAGANALVLGRAGATDQSVIAAGFQNVVAGNPGEQGSITITGTAAGGPANTFIVSNPVPGGTQTVSTSGALSIFGGTAAGGTAAGIFANGIEGQQFVSADAILLQGSATGSGNSAMIGANNGSQWVSAGAGGITLRGGAAGANNFAMINQLSTNPAYMQSIWSTGPVLLEGGAGNFNFAMIRAFGGHQGMSLGDTTLLAGAGGIDNFSVFQGRDQDITVNGDLAIIARGSASGPTAGGGARIGGLGGGAPTATSLRLNVAGDLEMTGGSVSGTGTILGNSPGIAAPTSISVWVGGNMAMNGGTAENTSATIGSRATNLAGGNVAIRADGDIALNGTSPDAAAAIRTADAVTMTARRITQAAEARIEAASLSVDTLEGASLTGANAVGALSASNVLSGDVAFSNASDLLTVTQLLNIPGALLLQQDGDLLVAGHVSSGPQTIGVTGGLRVENMPFGFAQIGAAGGQTIDAGYVEVVGNAGGSASIFNFDGEQRITTHSANAAGEGLAVRAFDGGFALIDAPSGPQTIDVLNADYLVVNGASGFANLSSFGGPQSIALSGAGANALVLGSPDASFQSLIAANDQTIVAGNPDEQGSITVYGTAQSGAGNALILTLAGAGGSQSVSTSGALSVLGGSAPGNSATGIFANQAGGTQTINAGSILLQGGDAGSGNSAQIGANSGSQAINAGAGGITLRGGATGGNNFAMINQASTDPAAAQTVISDGPVLLEGGSGNFNFAMIRAFGGHQDLSFGDTTLLAGAAGIDNFTSIQGTRQDMTVHGDLAIIARGSAGGPTAGGGARIGGTGGASPSPTSLRLVVDGDLTMTGGDLSGTGVALGNSPTFTGTTDIDVRVGGDATLNGGSVPDTFALIGSRAGSPAGGDIRLEAGGAIALNSTSAGRASVIRTTESVTLAAQRIIQGPDSSIEAGNLATHATDGASLVGANSVSALSMQNTAAGDLVFNNASALLTVTVIDQVPHGTLALGQDGDLVVSGDVTSGAQAISTTGDMTVSPGDGPGITVQAYGPQTFNVGGTFSLLGGAAWNGYAQTLASGPVSITTGNDLLVRGGGGLLAYALLYGGDDIHLTVGNELRIDGGSGPLAFARVQTDFWDRIFLTFPNRESGGYFVNGREGASRQGLDGFFTGVRPAILDRSLVVSYGD
jgi:filamentous hemagglutinin family protein